MPYTNLPDRRSRVSQIARDDEYDPRRGMTVQEAQDQDDQQYREHIQGQENDIDKSYFSQGLEFPEVGLGRTEGFEMPREDQPEPRRASDASAASADTLNSEHDRRMLKAPSTDSHLRSSPRQMESGDFRHARNRQPEAPEERGWFASLRDLDGDNEWDDLDDEELPEEMTKGGNGKIFDNLYEQVLDPDDPLVTGKHMECLEDPEDFEQEMWRQMSYKKRRKERARIRIEYNISSVVNRQKFLMKLGKSLMTFGAPSHRIEAQLLAAARILELEAEFVHVPGLIMCSFIDKETKSSETHFIKCSGRITLGRLHEVHQIYRSVVHDEISARRASEKLDALLSARPIYAPAWQCFMAFWIAALICPLAFGGSFIDMWIAGFGAGFLSIMRVGVISKAKQLYANVFEVCMAICISFAARALGSISNSFFCYNAISSASIVSILPGFLILSGSLELASKNIMCGSVKMVYALIYTLFLGFGLQIGNDVYLLFNRSQRHYLDALAVRLSTELSEAGVFSADNGTFTFVNDGQPLSGTFTFLDVNPFPQEHIIVGCLRVDGLPWYRQPFPWWAQFFIVPIFSIISSLSNLQPFFTLDMAVMVAIACVSYAANKVANHYILNRSDIVSSIGAFAVGMLGNAYSRKMGGTAFTVMVTGVLFLVPSGLSAVGGITAQGSGIDIGGAMISVTIGITVGLFVSQAIVYAFGARKNAAIFSF